METKRVRKRERDNTALEAFRLRLEVGDVNMICQTPCTDQTGSPPHFNAQVVASNYCAQFMKRQDTPVSVHMPLMCGMEIQQVMNSEAMMRSNGMMAVSHSPPLVQLYGSLNMKIALIAIELG